MQPPNQHEASGRPADSAARHEVKPMDRDKEKERGEPREYAEGRKWGTGKHLGLKTKKKKKRTVAWRWDEERREGRMNASFFTTRPIWMQPRVILFEADNPGNVHRRTLRHLAPNLLHLFLPKYYRSPLFCLPRASFRRRKRANVPPGITNSLLGRVLQDSLSRGKDSRGKTHKTFPVSFLPSVMFPGERGSGAEASRRT